MPSPAEDFQAEIRTGGVWAGLRWLNARVPHRYSAIFAFDGEILRNVCLVDKENLRITRCADQPITESYCIYVRRSGKPFGVEDANSDPSVEGHPKRHAVKCYYGIPLYGPSKKLLGTVCHFDVLPRPVTANIAEILDELASLIGDAVFVNEPKPDAAV